MGVSVVGGEVVKIDEFFDGNVRTNGKGEGDEVKCTRATPRSCPF